MTILMMSCNVTKEIYDDVYDQAELNPTIEVDENNGYADYIKKEEHKYKIEPEEDHYSYISLDNGNTFNNSTNFDYNDSEYYCYHHRRFHYHYVDTYFCSDWPNYNFSSFNNPYMPFGYAFGCNHNHYGGNNYFGYHHPCGNYWGNYGNVDPYSPWSVLFPNTQDALTSSNHHYGHRNGTSFGTTSNNTTVYAHTVKNTEATETTPTSGLPYDIADPIHMVVSKNIASNSTYPNVKPPVTTQNDFSSKPLNTQTATNIDKVDHSNPPTEQTSANTQKPVTTNKPATNPFSKPAKTNNTVVSKTGTNTNNSGGNANTNTNYDNKYNGSTNQNGTTAKTNSSSPTPSSSRRTNTQTTNSNNTTPSTNTNRGNNGSSTSGHRGGGGSGSSGSSNSGSSRR